MTSSEPGPLPATLEELYAALESDPNKHDEHDYHSRFRELRARLDAAGAVAPDGLLAEEIAFLLHAHDHQDPSGWGLFFGPMMSGTQANGEPWDVPPLSSITPEVVAYWRRRADESKHPVMRARYADLLWEMPKRLDHTEPDARYARLAIDSYLEAVDACRYDQEVVAVAKVKRALSLALAIGDSDRIPRARDSMIALEDRVAEDQMLGLWGFSFDELVEPPRKSIPVSDQQRDQIIAKMEARLSRLATAESPQYHPTGVETAAMSLARYYRRRGKADEIRRVMTIYADAVKRIRGTAPALLVSHSLEQLHDQLREFGLRPEADALHEMMREAGEASLAEMKPLEVTREIPREKVDAYFAEMLAGTADEVAIRIAVHFIPDRDQQKNQLETLAAKNPISFLMSRAIKGDGGRTLAIVGPIETDLEGQLLLHISQGLQLAVPWLRETVRRAIDDGRFTADMLREFLFKSPLYTEQRRPLIESGLAAYVKGDAIAAIHVLVPQIEETLRELALQSGVRVYSRMRNEAGGFLFRTLGDLLSDQDVVELLGTSVATYFRVLLTDPRGWNIRNDVSHGLATGGALSMVAADRVVHALLVLSLFRERIDPADPGSEVNR